MKAPMIIKRTMKGNTKTAKHPATWKARYNKKKTPTRKTAASNNNPNNFKKAYLKKKKSPIRHNRTMVHTKIGFIMRFTASIFSSPLLIK